MNIILTEEDFRLLISGKEVVKENLKIILSDIGYVKIAEIVTEAVETFLNKQE